MMDQDDKCWCIDIRENILLSVNRRVSKSEHYTKRIQPRSSKLNQLHFPQRNSCQTFARKENRRFPKCNLPSKASNISLKRNANGDAALLVGSPVTLLLSNSYVHSPRVGQISLNSNTHGNAVFDNEYLCFFGLKLNEASDRQRRWIARHGLLEDAIRDAPLAAI